MHQTQWGIGEQRPCWRGSAEAPQGFQKVKPGWGLPVPGRSPSSRPAPSALLRPALLSGTQAYLFWGAEAPGDSVRPRVPAWRAPMPSSGPPWSPLKTPNPARWWGGTTSRSEAGEGEWPGPERVSCFPSSQHDLIALFRGLWPQEANPGDPGWQDLWVFQQGTPSSVHASLGSFFLHPKGTPSFPGETWGSLLAQGHGGLLRVPGSKSTARQAPSLLCCLSTIF